AKATHVALRGEPVRYFPQSGSDVSARQAFDNFACTHNALPASVRVTDYDYGRPQLAVAHAASVSPTGLGEVADYGARLFSPGEARRIAEIRAEVFTAREVVYFGS